MIVDDGGRPVKVGTPTLVVTVVVWSVASDVAVFATYTLSGGNSDRVGCWGL